jgi:hypothetical protein
MNAAPSSLPKIQIQPITHADRLMRAHARLVLERRAEALARAKKEESVVSQRTSESRVREATKSTWHWLRHHTKTFNKQWIEQHRPSPHEPFPDYEYIEIALHLMEREPILAIEKSRTLMASWLTCGYFTLQMMLRPECEVIIQSETFEKAKQMVEYCKTLYRQQEPWLQEAFPVDRPVSRQADDEFFLANNSRCFAISSDPEAVRSYHPWGLFSDETGFQPYAGESFNTALGSGVQKIVLNSTANVGWYSAYRKDIQQ